MRDSLDYFALAASFFIIWMGMSVARMGQRAQRPALKRNLQLIGGAQAALGLGAMLMGMLSNRPDYFYPFILLLVISVPVTRHLIQIMTSRDSDSSTHETEG